MSKRRLSFEEHLITVALSTAAAWCGARLFLGHLTATTAAACLLGATAAAVITAAKDGKR